MENGSGGVSEERGVTEHVSLNAESRRRPESLHLRATAVAVGGRDSGSGGQERASETTLDTPAVWQMVR